MTRTTKILLGAAAIMAVAAGASFAGGIWSGPICLGGLASGICF